MNKKGKKTCKIEVLCTEDQFNFIAKKAKEHAMSNSEFGLFTMINSRIEVSLGSDPALSKIERALNLLDGGVISKEEFLKLKSSIFKDME